MKTCAEFYLRYCRNSYKAGIKNFKQGNKKSVAPRICRNKKNFLVKREKQLTSTYALNTAFFGKINLLYP